MAVSILFVVQDVGSAPKFSERDFLKILSILKDVHTIFKSGGSLNFGAALKWRGLC